MQYEKYLNFGLVVNLSGHYVYDHILHNVISYADNIADLLANAKPIASLYSTSEHASVNSPIFRYEQKTGGLEWFQSAYYLVDSLTRKNILPVYLPKTREVKDLYRLISQENRRDAVADAVIQILRARYIRAASRKPSKSFMEQQITADTISPDTIEMSDEEMLKLFGRLPVSAAQRAAEKAPSESDVFISDSVARRA
ncbi:MAG: hypothetical protein ACI9Y1_003692 [Lentisphaeria bacterium]|jgi:hypothetical protein